MSGDELQAHWPDRIAAVLARRPAGRRIRVLRRLLALALLLGAAAVAIAHQRAPGPGQPVTEVVRDLAAGYRLTAADLHIVQLTSRPDGALERTAQATGHTLAGAIRRGEILTDARLVPDSGPSPGPGRSAVPISLTDAPTARLLTPGMHLAVLAVGEDGVGHQVTSDAVVLAVTGADDRAGAGELVLLAVPDRDANAVAASSLSEKITVRFM